MDFDLEKKRFQALFFVVAIIGLSITAEKCRQMVGEDASSKSGKFTFLNCFDMSSGTIACTVKEGVKLYFYSIRTGHVERARNQAIEAALTEALNKGLAAQEAAKEAQTEGKRAAKLATRQAKRIIGPIVSSGWDFFEAIYFGGTLTEAFLRGSGTLVGAYSCGFLGEQRLGRFGYVIGSQLGSWVGGRIGLMVYDVVNGVHFLLGTAQNAEDVLVINADSNSEAYEEYLSFDGNYESQGYNAETKSSFSDEDLGVQETTTPTYESTGTESYEEL